jgi:hypothetical protein
MCRACRLLQSLLSVVENGLLSQLLYMLHNSGNSNINITVSICVYSMEIHIKFYMLLFCLSVCYA